MWISTWNQFCLAAIHSYKQTTPANNNAESDTLIWLTYNTGKWKWPPCKVLLVINAEGDSLIRLTINSGKWKWPPCKVLALLHACWYSLMMCF